MSGEVLDAQVERVVEQAFAARIFPLLADFGGKGSGFRGHKGIKGHRGGSLPGTAGGTPADAARWPTPAQETAARAWERRFIDRQEENLAVIDADGKRRVEIVGERYNIYVPAEVEESGVLRGALVVHNHPSDPSVVPGLSEDDLSFMMRVSAGEMRAVGRMQDGVVCRWVLRWQDGAVPDDIPMHRARARQFIVAREYTEWLSAPLTISTSDVECREAKRLYMAAFTAHMARDGWQLSYSDEVVEDKDW